MRVTEPNLLSPPMERTKMLRAPRGELSEASVMDCLEELLRGGLVVFPTDTVYGIGCVATRQDAVRKIYQLKGREDRKPLPLLLPHPDQIDLVAEDQRPEVGRLIKSFWPGPLTLVFKAAPFAKWVTGGRETVAVRVPDHGVARQILDRLGLPLAATSANASGAAVLNTGFELVEQFGGKVDVIVDGGSCPLGEASSVVDVTHYPFTVLREGVLRKEKLLAAMGMN